MLISVKLSVKTRLFLTFSLTHYSVWIFILFQIFRFYWVFKNSLNSIKKAQSAIIGNFRASQISLCETIRKNPISISTYIRFTRSLMSTISFCGYIITVLSRQNLSLQSDDSIKNQSVFKQILKEIFHIIKAFNTA